MLSDTSITSKMASSLTDCDPSSSASQDVSEESHMTWKMRWCFFWMGASLSILWIVVVVGVTLYTLHITGNLLSLLISFASALPLEFIRRFANYLLPMDEKRFQLAKIRIEMKVQKRVVKT